jgi:acyl carrier protein
MPPEVPRADRAIPFQQRHHLRSGVPGLSTQPQQLDEVKRWFLDRRPDLLDLDPDLDLIENRVLDSLGSVTFIIFLESLTGREIQPSAFSPSTFRTLRSIHDGLLASVAGK